MAVDREKLYNALHTSGSEVLYHWVQNMKQQFELEPIHLQSLGNISIPISSENITQIRSARKSSSNGTKSFAPIQVAGKNITLHPSIANKPSARTVVDTLVPFVISKAFNIDLTNTSLNVRANLDRLILSQNPETFRECFNFEKEPGMFGTILFFIPQNDAPGQLGRLTISYNTQKVSFQLNQPHPQDIIIACIAGERVTRGRQDYLIETNAGKSLAVLIFNLIWMDSFNLGNFLRPDKFPRFIEAVRQAREALSGWKENSSSSVSIPPNKDPNFLCIGLENNYDARTFCLSRLKDADMFAAQVLSSINYIGISLADTVTERYVCSDWREAIKKYPRQLSLNHWSSSSCSPLELDPQFGVLIAQTSLVGRLSARITIETAHEWQQTTRSTNHFGVIVIRPRYTLPPVAPKCSKLLMKNFFNKLPIALKSMAEGNYSLRQELLADLKSLITPTNNSSSIKITTANCAEFWPSTSFLDACIRLQAREEGLVLLKMIIDCKCLCGQHNQRESMFGYLYSSGSALYHTLAEFARKFGWNSCKDPLIQFVSTERPYSVGTGVIELCETLFLCGCTEAAFQILDALIKKVTDTNAGNESAPFIAAIGSFIDLAQTSHKQAAEKRYQALIIFLNNLKEVRELLGVIKHIDKHPFVVRSPTLKKFLLHIGNSISQLNWLDVNELVYRDVIKYYNNLSRNEFLRIANAITGKMLKDYVLHSRNEKKQTSFLFDRLIMSCETRSEGIAFLDKLSKITSASQALDSFVYNFVQELKVAGEQAKDDEEVILDLLECLGKCATFVCLAENEKTLSNPERVEAFCTGFSYVGLRHLGRLVLDLHEGNGDRFKNKPVASSVYRKLLEQILKRNIIKLAEYCHDRFADIFRCFLWYGDTELIKDLVRLITHNPKGDHVYSLPSRDLVVHVPRIFEIRGIFGEPCHDGVQKLDRVDLNSLIKYWIRSEIDHERKLVTLGNRDAGIGECLSTFVKMEMYQPEEDLNEIVAFFSEWLALLKSPTLMKTILKLYRNEAKKSGPSLKKFKSCFKIFRELCLKLVDNSQQFSEVFNIELDVKSALELFNSFLWLGEERPIFEFAKCTALIPVVGSKLSKLNHKLALSHSIQEEAKKTQLGRKVFSQILEQWIAAISKALTENVPDWSMDVGYKNCEAKFLKFLTSNVQKHTFGPYVVEQAAEKIAKRFITNPSWGLSYSVKKLTTGLYGCEIIKSQCRFHSLPHTSYLNKKLAKLREVRNSVSSWPLIESSISTIANGSTEINYSTDEVEVLPPPVKRARTECFTID